jgi:hypothetical protein
VHQRRQVARPVVGDDVGHQRRPPGLDGGEVDAHDLEGEPGAVAEVVVQRGFVAGTDGLVQLARGDPVDTVPGEEQSAVLEQCVPGARSGHVPDPTGANRAVDRC